MTYKTDITSPQILRHVTITYDELDDTIKELPNNKAAGINTIINKMIKNCPQKNNGTTYLYNKCQKAVIIPIKKPGKIATNPGNY